MSPGGRPGARAGEEGAGWTGSAGLCSAYKQAPPAPHTLAVVPALHAVRPRSGPCVSGSVFSSLSPHFLDHDHPLHGGAGFRGLGSSSPTLLPALCSSSGGPLAASGQSFSGVSPKLTFRPTPPSSPTFQLPPALGGPSRKPCRCLRLGTSPAELATFPCVLPPPPKSLPLLSSLLFW